MDFQESKKTVYYFFYREDIDKCFQIISPFLFLLNDIKNFYSKFVEDFISVVFLPKTELKHSVA